jgi:hypothetical protein
MAASQRVFDITKKEKEPDQRQSRGQKRKKRDFYSD